MRIGSLCTGIAGLELGLQYAGIETKPVFVSDIDPAHATGSTKPCPTPQTLATLLSLMSYPRSTSSPQGFPANQYQPQDYDKESTMTDGSSMTSADLLAEWTHDPSSSSRTSPASSLQTVGKLWVESFTDWPTSGTTSPGGLFQQPPLEHPINATDGGGLLGTPRTSTKNGASSIAVAKGEHRPK